MEQNSSILNTEYAEGTPMYNDKKLKTASAYYQSKPKIVLRESQTDILDPGANKKAAKARGPKSAKNPGKNSRKKQFSPNDSKPTDSNL